MNLWQRLTGFEQRHRQALDGILAGLFGLFALPLDLLMASTTTRGNVPVALGVISVFVQVIALAWRRTKPVPSAVVIYAMAAFHLLFGMSATVSDLSVLGALYALTVVGPTWAHRTGVVTAVLGSASLSLVSGHVSLIEATVSIGFTTFLTLSVWAAGLLVRGRREMLESLVDRARRLEIERDQQAELAASTERTRIAREMHDVVAHSLSVVIAQADGGRFAAARDPAAAEHALATIAVTGRHALADMRRIIGVLRTGDSPATLTAPQPGLADIDDLVAGVRDAGTAVTVIRTGLERELPVGIGLSLFRVCQEGLTNVLKHAGAGAAATVEIAMAPTMVSLRISDTGTGASASDGRGNGIVGMRERVAAFGGTLRTTTTPSGGFVVEAHIPTPPPPDAPAEPPPVLTVASPPHPRPQLTSAPQPPRTRHA